MGFLRKILAQTLVPTPEAPTSVQAPEEQAERFWSNRENHWKPGGGLHWMEIAQVRERVHRKISGDPRRDGYQHLIGVLEQRGVSLPLERCLSLGCGLGQLERGLSQYRLCTRHDAYDISEQAIEAARDLARQVGLRHIRYQVADLDELELSPGSYELVFGIQAIHHLENLEHAFKNIHRALKDDGLLLLDEYVGPDRLQWTDRQLRAVDALLSLLPEDLRLDNQGRLRSHLRRYSLEEMENNDPSESIRSSDILDVLEQHFVIVERRDYGGTILHPLLDGIAFNFNTGEPRASRLLEMAFEVEDALLETGELSSDFVYLIAEKR